VCVYVNVMEIKVTMMMVLRELFEDEDEEGRLEGIVLKGEIPHKD